MRDAPSCPGSCRGDAGADVPLWLAIARVVIFWSEVGAEAGLWWPRLVHSLSHSPLPCRQAPPARTMRLLLILVYAGMLLGCGQRRSDDCVLAVSAVGPNGGTLAWERSATGALVHVRSDSGIGAGQIDLVSGAWPSVLTVRLHLHGLEGIRMSSGDRYLEPVSRQGPIPVGDSQYFEVTYDVTACASDVPLQIHYVDFYR